MRDWLLGIVIVLIVLIVVGGMGMVATGYDFAMFKFWAPKYANAQREVFENTQGYVEGKAAYLTTLRFQYQGAVGPQQVALRSLILSEASTVDNNKLPPDLQGFIQQLKGN